MEQAANLVTGVDLRWGGGLVAQLGKVVLRWAVGLSDAAMTDDTYLRWHCAVGHLAQRAGWAAFDAEAHDTARSLFTAALDAAVRAKDRNLRAHVLTDVGAQHNHLGYPDDCLEIVGLVEGDRRLHHAVRAVIYGVKARAHAALGDVGQCREHLELAEQEHAKALADQPDGWLGSLCTPAHLAAMTGHATATLARHTNTEVDRADAHHRLTEAVTQLDPATHTRAWGLCVSRLAVMHLDAGDHKLGVGLARQALQTAMATRSARLVRQVKLIGATANAHPYQPMLRQLTDEIDTALNPPPEAEAEVEHPPEVEAEAEDAQ